jgi:hypothetical protein
MIFYNFHESFYLGQKKGGQRDKRKKKNYGLPNPPSCGSALLSLSWGLKDMWEKEGQKGLKEPWA